MIPDFVASDDVPRKLTRSNPGGPTAPRATGQPSLPHDGTIDPSLLMVENHEPLSQHSTSSIPLHTSGDGHSQHLAPAFSASTEVWVVYPGDQPSTSALSPISPTLGNWDSISVTFVDSCICGCGGGACIPQREYNRQRTDPLCQQELQEVIRFSVNGTCGYPLEDALKKRYAGLDGRDDKMFVGCKSSISLRLEWLPYRNWTKQIRTLNWKKDSNNISRAKLTTEVAKRMKAFFEEMRFKEADRSYWKYRIQPGVIDFNHLQLVALKRVSKSSWMPHFRLIAPSRRRDVAPPPLPPTAHLV